MSKKEKFALILLFIFVSWGLVSLYYYNQHIVTVKEYKVGEKIELSEGIVIIHSIEIQDFERKNPLDFERTLWFYDAVFPKIPTNLHMNVMKIIAFYNKPYNFDLGTDDVEGRIMNVKGIYVSKNEEDEQYDQVNVGVVTEDGVSLAGRTIGSRWTADSNIRMFSSSGNFLLNEYTPESDENLIITVRDKLNNESYKVNIKAAWETKKYNFFNRFPGEYAFSPDEIVNSFISTAIYEKDIDLAEEMVHPQINNFPWSNLKHDKWSKGQERITYYKGSYSGFNDVFFTRITFGDIEEEQAKEIFEQNIYLVNYDGEWKIIDVTPVSANLTQHPEAIAIVDDDLVITMDEVQVLIELSKQLNNQDISLEEAVRIRAQNKLLLQEARRRNISIPEQEQHELVANEVKDIKGSINHILPIMLKVHGVAEEEYWEEIFFNETIVVKTRGSDKISFIRNRFIIESGG